MQSTDQESRIVKESQSLSDTVKDLLHQIQSWIQELKRRNLELDLLNRMASAFHKCQTVDDIQFQLTQFAFRLFMEQPGELFLLNEQKQILEKVVTWGEIHKDPALLRREYCRSLQHQKICLFSDEPGLNCSHHQTISGEAESATRYLCSPLLYQDRLLGLLHQHLPEMTTILKEMSWLDEDHWKQLATSVSERLASALNTIRISKTKPPNEYRDSLTHLLNRWYMQETLERELHYAMRHQTSLWVFSLDIDRMKKVNERFGFETGDEVLRKISRYLQSNIRAEDVISRSGGDEFTIILLGMPSQTAYLRAQKLREGIKDLHIDVPNLFPIGITCSFGLACFPEHGKKGTDLLVAAQQALRHAKTSGRDQVQIAS